MIPPLIDRRPRQAAPPWAWLGGLPGALTVVLAALCLNSPLGMAGTLALLLLDALAGRLAASDLLGILLVLAGAALQRWQAGKPRSRG